MLLCRLQAVGSLKATLTSCLFFLRQEAHEALFELEMDALEAQRITQETHDILALDDAPEPIVSAPPPTITYAKVCVCAVCRWVQETGAGMPACTFAHG